MSVSRSVNATQRPSGETCGSLSAPQAYEVVGREGLASAANGAAAAGAGTGWAAKGAAPKAAAARANGSSKAGRGRMRKAPGLRWGRQL